MTSKKKSRAAKTAKESAPVAETCPAEAGNRSHLRLPEEVEDAAQRILAKTLDKDLRQAADMFRLANTALLACRSGLKVEMSARVSRFGTEVTIWGEGVTCQSFKDPREALGCLYGIILEAATESAGTAEEGKEVEA